jgi:prepilin-type N-terminal cleavage/methylation domain-containing protein
MTITKKSAFTLIELLIVVAIIGILAAIAVPNFMNAQIRARIARVEADAKSTATALEQYRLDNNTYPVDAMNMNPIGLYMLTTPVPYMSSPPVDIFKPKLRVGTTDTGGGSGGNVMGRYVELGTDTGYENKVGSWILASSGPDADDDVNRMPAWPFGTVFWEFDPSNGLNSNGDLVKMGGSFNQGHFTRNGEQYP